MVIRSFGFTTGFGAFSLLFTCAFFLFFGFIAALIIKAVYSSLASERSDGISPVLTVPAAVVAKRSYVSGANYSRHHSNYRAGTIGTEYFVTFEVESGDRIELRVDESHFGMLVEDDVGRLTFQFHGRRFISFERNKNTN